MTINTNGPLSEPWEAPSAAEVLNGNAVAFVVILTAETVQSKQFLLFH